MLPKIPAWILDGVKKTTKEISVGNCSFKPLSKEKDTLDGLNPQCAIIDEAAAIKERTTIESVTSGMGARLSSLKLYITTPQPLTSTHYFELRESARMILENIIPAKYGLRQFAMLYGLDRKSEVNNPKYWVKANPNVGISVSFDFLHEKVLDIAKTPAESPTILMKNFCLWVKQSTQWLSAFEWNACQSRVLRDGDCYVGCDLALSKFLNAVARIWTQYTGQVFVDWHFWTNQTSFDNVPDYLKPVFVEAKNSGILTVQPGKISNLGDVYTYITDTFADHSVQHICIDPYNARDLANDLAEENMPVHFVNQSISRLNDATQRCESMVRDGKLIHDGNPFLRHQLENCVKYKAQNNNIKILRNVDNEYAAMDAFAALITGLAGLETGKQPEASGNFAFVKL